MTSPAPTILLDLDGTLIDSLPGIQASCEAALTALGHTPNPTLDMSALIGPPIDDIMRWLLAPYHDDRVTEAVVAYRADYGQNGLFNSVCYPGVAQALHNMRQAGASLYLATSKRTVFARRILDHLGLNTYFDGIYGSEPGGDLDEKPELIAAIIKRHALISDQCIMVGDRRYDIVGAHANKIGALGVLWGYGSRDELQAAGADDLISQPTDLAAASLTIALAAKK